MTLCKARLVELNDKFTDIKSGGLNVPVQFNPESLKISYTNELAEAKGGDKAAGSAGRQFVGAKPTKLSLQLWFDVTAMEASTDPKNTGEKGIVDDVRRLTQQVVFFMTPTGDDAAPQGPPPGVRFEWGSFAFDGMVEGIEETIEYFSPEGKPLRASISLTLVAQKTLRRDKKKDTGNLPARPGHTPLKVARQGDSLQAMAARGGKDDWQSIAAAHGIEDALRMSPGQFIDLNAGAGVDIGVGGSAAANFSFGAALGTASGGSAGLNASLGGSASASLSFN